jgi:hypothetical protein
MTAAGSCFGPRWATLKSIRMVFSDELPRVADVVYSETVFG